MPGKYKASPGQPVIQQAPDYRPGAATSAAFTPEMPSELVTFFGNKRAQGKIGIGLPVIGKPRAKSRLDQFTAEPIDVPIEKPEQAPGTRNLLAEANDPALAKFKARFFEGTTKGGKPQFELPGGKAVAAADWLTPEGRKVFGKRFLDLTDLSPEEVPYLVRYARPEKLRQFLVSNGIAAQDAEEVLATLER